MDACKPLLRRRPCQLLRLWLLALGLLLVHHGILWGFCMDACNHLLRRRAMPAAAAAPVGHACNHLLCRLWLRRRPCLLLRLRSLAMPQLPRVWERAVL